jgi:integrase
MRKIVNGGTESVPAFGSIYRPRNTSRLHVSFRYFGQRVRLSTGYDDTPANRVKLSLLLNRVGDEIKAQAFRFAETFPQASPEQKAHFSNLEGREYRPLARHVLFRDYVPHWVERELATYPEQLREDYLGIINSRLLPHLGGHPFDRLTGPGLKDFIEELRHTDGPHKGKYLSVKRMKNVLTVFRTIYTDACDHYRWLDQPYPAETVRKKIAAVKRNLEEQGPATAGAPRTVFLLSEWHDLLTAIDPCYHPLLHVMAMTGLIFSELKGLKREHVKADHIEIRTVVVRGREKLKPKTKYRVRNIPFTRALRLWLERAIGQAPGEHVFVMRSGCPLIYSSLMKLWTRGLRQAGLAYRVPYAARHSFTEWALLIGVTPSRLQAMMGHGSRKMINEVYGSYRDGLVGERTRILDYFGADFLEPEELRAAHPHLYPRPAGQHPNHAVASGPGNVPGARPETQKAPNLSAAPGQSVGQSLRLFADNYLK